MVITTEQKKYMKSYINDVIGKKQGGKENHRENYRDKNLCENGANCVYNLFHKCLYHHNSDTHRIKCPYGGGYCKYGKVCKFNHIEFERKCYKCSHHGWCEVCRSYHPGIDETRWYASHSRAIIHLHSYSSRTRQ